MAHDDRNRSFEKALARHLRSSASSEMDGNALGAAPLESCPDAEILAAYHDGSLSSDERNLWKQHVLGCDNCQLILAHLATPLEVPVTPETSERVSVINTAAVAKVSSLDALQVSRANRPPSLRWLWFVPAGAIAAGLIAFISLRSPKPLQVATGSPVEVAENRQPSAVGSSPQTQLVVPGERKQKDQRTDQPAGGIAGPVSSDRDAVADELRKQAQSAQQAPYADAAKTASGPSLSRQKQEQQQLAARTAGAAGATRDQKKFDAQTAPGLPENGRLTAAPQTLPPPLPSQPGFIAGGTVEGPLAEKERLPAPASNAAAAKPKVANDNAISAVTESVEVSAEPTSRAEAKAMMRAAALQNPHVFIAPDGKQLWRVGPSGSLEHSSDRGLKWTVQTSGVNTDLLAGSAPSAKVCWVVGNSGTILRTTDSGAHWTKLDSPISNDLVGVRAADAMHASIWFVPGQPPGSVKTYQTTDGGVTWYSVPGE
ncbi:MAG TPA: hypothetical protein VNH65_18260 [Candidatus Acidoferrum sp.]|nr:hypothetical protein [Candidatus Acidoferrum sp.]